MDIFNPFVIEMKVDNPPRNVTVGNGNDALEDLSEFPIIQQDAPAEVQVSTPKPRLYQTLNPDQNWIKLNQVECKHPRLSICKLD